MLEMMGEEEAQRQMKEFEEKMKAESQGIDPEDEGQGIIFAKEAMPENQIEEDRIPFVSELANCNRQ